LEESEEDSKKISITCLKNTSRNCWGNALAQILASLCPKEIAEIISKYKEVKLPSHINAIFDFLKMIYDLNNNKIPSTQESISIWNAIRKNVFERNG
jgi:hypothetical protein